jgi:hypothetical protein
MGCTEAMESLRRHDPAWGFRDGFLEEVVLQS